MRKVVLFAFREEPGCFAHAMLNALDMKLRGWDVKLVIEGEELVLSLKPHWIYILIDRPLVLVFAILADAELDGLVVVRLVLAGLAGMFGAVVIVGIAVVVAWPLAYFGMSRWLEGFAYRADLVWWLFAAAGLVTLGIAVLTATAAALTGARISDEIAKDLTTQTPERIRAQLPEYL